MKSVSVKLNSEYAGIFALYWMHYGVIASFCSAYLIGIGYSNSEIGVILAASGAVSVFLQPILADISDRSVKLSSIGVAQISTVLMLILNLALFVFTRKSAALWTVYMLLMAWNLALQPLFNSLQRKLSETGVPINFGICRAGGSLGYSVFTAVIGILVEKMGTEVLPSAGVIVLSLLFILLVLTNNTLRRSSANQEAINEKSTKPEKEIGLTEFFNRNKLFVILNFFILILFFQNSVLNNFMFQIVENVGGGTKEMGKILSFMAFVEIPALFFFDKIRAIFSCRTLLKIASVAFLLKIAIIYSAQSVGIIFAAHFFHIFSFGIFLPAIVVFINEIMEKGELVKGQALFTIALTISNIFASVSGGVMLDRFGAELMLLISVIATAVGMVGVIALIGKIREKPEKY